MYHANSLIAPGYVGRRLRQLFVGALGQRTGDERGQLGGTPRVVAQGSSGQRLPAIVVGLDLVATTAGLSKPTLASLTETFETGMTFVSGSTDMAEGKCARKQPECAD